MNKFIIPMTFYTMRITSLYKNNTLYRINATDATKTEDSIEFNSVNIVNKQNILYKIEDTLYI